MCKIHNIKFTTIKDGIFKTSKWFEKNYNKKNGIRLWEFILREEKGF